MGIGTAFNFLHCMKESPLGVIDSARGSGVHVHSCMAPGPSKHLYKQPSPKMECNKCVIAMAALSGAIRCHGNMVAAMVFAGVLMGSLAGVQSIGICYGMQGDNLPSRSDVVQLYKSRGIQQMRIYDPDEQALNALRGSGIELIVGVPNDRLRDMGDQSAANDWVQRNIISYSDVRFKYIAVGNEVFPHSGNYNDAPLVLPAMRNIQNAIRTAGLQDQIKVSTAVYSPILTDPFPPSRTRFNDDAAQHMRGIVSFLAETGAPLLANVYPYISKKLTDSISLSYALFQQAEDTPGAPGYKSLFDAMVDGFYFAMEKLGGPTVPLVVSESGWPSGGNPLATKENAQTYNQNLINHVRGGTPKKPGQLETYIFAMFNENRKTGDPEENYFGLFNPDKTPVYDINFG